MTWRLILMISAAVTIGGAPVVAQACTPPRPTIYFDEASPRAGQDEQIEDLRSLAIRIHSADVFIAVPTDFAGLEAERLAASRRDWLNDLFRDEGVEPDILTFAPVNTGPRAIASSAELTDPVLSNHLEIRPLFMREGSLVDGCGTPIHSTEDAQ